MSVNRGLTKGPSKAQMETSSQKSSDKQSQLSVISETSSMLVGSVSSAAAKAPLKESKTIVKDRSIVFWTPVMIWPTGFFKSHKKQTIEYKSDSCLHNGKKPYLPNSL